MAIEKKILAVCIIATAMASLPQYSNAQSIPGWGEPYSSTVKPEQILDALRNADWQYAIRLSTDYVIEYLKTSNNLEKLAAKGLILAAKELQKILNDNSKTTEQKRDEINKLVDDSILNYESSMSGELNATYKYSLDYGIARVIFDSPTRYDKCGYRVSVQIGIGTGSVGGQYYDIYATRSPRVTVSRLIEGAPDAMVVSFDSVIRINESGGSIGSISDYWAAANSLYSAYKSLHSASNNPAAIPSRPAVDIPTGIYLGQSKKVGYRIDLQYQKYDQCPQINKSSIVWIDSDKDGKVDIVPAKDYANYWVKVNGDVLNSVIAGYLLAK